MTELEIQELSKFLYEFNNESDRGATLIAASYIEDILERILRNFLTKSEESEKLLSGFNAPLGTFSAKISATYALGLLQENEFQEINIIRKIRNEFAHSWQDIDFTNNKIVGYCSNLSWLGPDDPEIDKSPRNKFNFAVAILFSDLLWRARLVKKERRQIKNWPNKSRNNS